MEFEKIRLYYNRCRVEEPLSPDDPRNVDIDHCLGSVRGSNWVEKLGRKVELSTEPVCLLFSGLPGSGKSTELRRLQVRLQDPARSHLLSVIINAEEVLDLNAPIDVADILAALVDGVEREILVAEHKNPESALQDRYSTRLWNWLTRTDVSLVKGEFAIPEGPKLLVEMKTRPTLRQRLRETIGQHLSEFLRQVQNEMIELEARAKKCGWSGLFVAIDSLEKLSGSGESFRAVLDSAETVFARGASHLRLPVHVMYTVPPSLWTRQREMIHFMPVVKVRDKHQGTLDAEGYSVLRTLVRKRIPDDDLAEILGPRCEARLNEIFALSGGYPREIVQILRSLLISPEFPVSDHFFKVTLNEIRAGYRMVTPSAAFEWLARVDKEHFWTTESDDHRRIADSVLSNNGLLYYYNGEPWWGLHPAVRSIPGVQAAIKALEP